MSLRIFRVYLLRTHRPFLQLHCRYNEAQSL